MGELGRRPKLVAGLALLSAEVARARLIFLCSVLIVCAPFDGMAAAASGHHYKLCFGYYALCDASTCTPTGGTVTVNVIGGGTAEFPEADCVCPILYGSATADLNGGQMSGSCAPPSADELWSIWSRAKYVPQAVHDWAQWGPLARAKKQICPASLNLGDKSVNCFGFVCDSARLINSVPVVTCHCALGEAFDGTAVSPDTAFWTDAGQGDPVFCSQYPAATPLPFARKRGN